MLLVRVELHSAITGEVTEIARMVIANEGGGTKERANYTGCVAKGRKSEPSGPEAWDEQIL